MKWTVALVIALATTLSPSPSGLASAAGEGRVHDTYVIGDSMTVRANIPYLHDMHPSWYVDGRSGRPVSDLPKTIRFMRDRVGFRANVVLALGTNPARRGQSWTKASYEGVVDQIPRSSNVFLVTTYRSADRVGHIKVWRHARWMRQIARERSNVHIVDWRRHVMQGKVSVPDGIHASRGEGERYWADLVSRRVVAVNR